MVPTGSLRIKCPNLLPSLERELEHNAKHLFSTKGSHLIREIGSSYQEHRNVSVLEKHNAGFECKSTDFVGSARDSCICFHMIYGGGHTCRKQSSDNEFEVEALRRQSDLFEHLKVVRGGPAYRACLAELNRLATRREAEVRVGGVSEDKQLAETEISDFAEKIDYEELLQGSEVLDIAGTSKMEVENAKLRAELASKIAFMCSNCPEFDYESLDDMEQRLSDRILGHAHSAADGVSNNCYSCENDVTAKISVSVGFIYVNPHRDEEHENHPVKARKDTTLAGGDMALATEVPWLELLDESQMNCAHLENCLHEAREEAQTHLCAADRRASEYSALVLLQSKCAASLKD
ncbi:hypothetical protein HAX54_044251 [Datura stramonium]|uniref:Uncharacterized protein n=1 Tax=Datura stramonium TaxID=4076 RepID=A0ABS8SPH6_DATST|nr:hypothetical protein [Datura stramonium]